MGERRKVKVLFLMEYPIDLPGGGQMSTQTLCEGISAYSRKDNSVYDFKSFDDTYDFVPIVCCPNLLNKKKEDYPFETVTYSSDENREFSKVLRIKNFFGRVGSFGRIIKETQPDIIHVSMSESLITFGMLRLTGHFSKIPFIYTDRGLCFGYRKHSKTLIKATMKKASKMLTTTQFNRLLWEKEGIGCDIQVINNTISSAFDLYFPEKRDELRKSRNVGEGEFVIGFAGRISEEKDWDFVPVFVRELKKAGLSFKVALVLSVYEAEDAKTVERIKNGITDAIGEDNLIYMQDLSQKEISDYYYLVDLFVMTSCFESFGKAAVEAMSRECAVISTKVGGLPEVIGKSENLYDKNEPEEYVKMVGRYIEDRDKLESDRKYFRQRFLDNYTKEKNILSHIDVYKEILEK